ncbi:hypothetical protein NHX12_032750 [Muraenolepis orangiensis]|uniref:Uncharacterized protein n=1 Tax=Muraenolepis orangiensis TaxID=630683 RepID=A0A9Q0E3U5_9TELE|nr:hypothetical protein NHX12_032750 [Muraenolepis orangiensis]
MVKGPLPRDYSSGYPGPFDTHWALAGTERSTCSNPTNPPSVTACPPNPPPPPRQPCPTPPQPHPCGTGVMADASAHMTAASCGDAEGALMPAVTFSECHITSGLDNTR